MNVHNTSIHIPVRQNTVCHICHIFDLPETMKGNLAVDAFIALRCTVFVPWGLDKSRCNSIDSDSFWLKLLHQRFGQEMNGCLGNSVHNRRRIRLASCIGTHKSTLPPSVITGISSFTINTGIDRFVFTMLFHSPKV